VTAWLVNTLVGSSRVAGGAAALNQVFERTTDALMRRTRNRPLAAGRLGSAEGSALGAGLAIGGLRELAPRVFDRRPRRARAFPQPHRGRGGRRDAGELRVRLHAAQDADLARHA